MNQEKIVELLTNIKNFNQWREEQPDSDINLSGADLSGADLRGAKLSWADLRGAKLSWADLSGADLRGAWLSWADLSGADLSGADLSWAKLSGVAFCGTIGVLIAQFDPRNYTLVVWKCQGKPRVKAGCRDFSFEEALAHWGSSDYPDAARGQMYVQMIKLLSASFEEGV